MQYSTSAIQRYKDCPLSYKLHYEDGLRPQDEEISHHHMNYGSAVHEALDKLYDFSNLNVMLEGNSLKLARAAFSKAYPRQMDPNDNAKTKDAGMAMLGDYVNHYSTGGVLDPQWRVLSREKLELFPDYVSDPFVLKMDLVVENIEHGGIYGVDHKVTKKKLDYAFWRKFNPSSQVTRYSHFIKEKYGACDGFYINGISMNYSSRRSTRGGVKYEAGPYWNFERQMFNHTSEQFAAEQIDTQLWINDIEQSRLYGAWRRDTNECAFCDFHGICSKGLTYPEDAGLIQLEYAVKERPR